MCWEFFAKLDYSKLFSASSKKFLQTTLSAFVLVPASNVLSSLLVISSAFIATKRLAIRSPSPMEHLVEFIIAPLTSESAAEKHCELSYHRFRSLQFNILGDYNNPLEAALGEDSSPSISTSAFFLACPPSWHALNGYLTCRSPALAILRHLL